MADTMAIVEGLAQRLETLEGLTVYREPPGSVDAPAAAVSLAPGNYDSTMDRDSDDLVFVIDLFVTTGPQGMENLYAYLDGSGGMSVKAAIESDGTLDGVVEFVTVTNWSKPDRAGVGQGEFFHTEITVEVGARG